MLTLHSYVAGTQTGNGSSIDVFNPWNGELVGKVSCISQNQLQECIDRHCASSIQLSRYERSCILNRSRALLEERKEEFAQLITAEAGLCLRETRYEVGRACDVLAFSAMEALRDDGQIFSCDISPNGKARKIYTMREPVSLLAAITPFNHPLNQVVHKLAPAIAVGAKIILKPSEKTPLVATRFTELLYHAGLPGELLSCVHGDLDKVTRPLIQNKNVELVSFTGSAVVGKEIAATAGYKKTCLELGGHSPLIVLEDADLDLAVKLACEGCFRNSGQRCTAVRRLLIQESIIDRFTTMFVKLARTYQCGNPSDEETVVGTVIDQAAAIRLEQAIADAVSMGARVLLGGKREGALLPPTILADMSRKSVMATCECFGPLAPIYSISDLDDAITFSNDSDYGLSSGIVTSSLSSAMRAVKEIKAGTVNVNEIPGYRLELSPFGGIKDSGLGIKEGVVEAMKFMTNVKTYSLPW
jgi:putative phosphonoacetaldehyde dehydrogenase